MKRFVALIAIVLCPGLAAAEKSFTAGKGAAWDCKTDPVVSINHGRGTYTFKGECKRIHMNGGQGKLTIESVDDLEVTGAQNTITIGTVDKINVVGASNTIKWKKAKQGDKPAVNIVGAGNKIEGDGGGGAGTGGGGGAGTGGGGGGGDKPADKAAPAPAGAIDCAKQPSHTVATGDNDLTFVGTCDTITLNGGTNKLTVENVKTLAIMGAENTVTVGGVDKISLIGSDNKVSYKKGLSGAKPKISNVGTNNKAEQVK